MKKTTLKQEIFYKELEFQQVSRRLFLRNTIAASVFVNFPFIQSCISDDVSTSILSEKHQRIVIAIQNILFPKDKHGPGAADFGAHKYLLWILQDERIDPNEKEYIRKGIYWVEETAQEERNEAFLKLTKKEQVKLIGFISKQNWGESWLSTMMNMIIEAMISDPIYGFNTNGIGWRWLSHIPGLPRPSNDTLYDQIFLTVLENK